MTTPPSERWCDYSSFPFDNRRYAGASLEILWLRRTIHCKGHGTLSCLVNKGFPPHSIPPVLGGTSDYNAHVDNWVRQRLSLEDAMSGAPLIRNTEWANAGPSPPVLDSKPAPPRNRQALVWRTFATAVASAETLSATTHTQQQQQQQPHLYGWNANQEKPTRSLQDVGVASIMSWRPGPKRPTWKHGTPNFVPIIDD